MLFMVALHAAYHATMTTVNEQAPGQVMNGAAPPPAQDPAAPGELAVSAGERLMGVIGIAFAVGLLAIGIDLMTGGALARMFTAAANGEPGAGAGG